jgi:hypothetical protein
MKETVYVESSFWGCLTARPSRDLVVITNTQITGEWWERRRQDFDLYISQIALDEVTRGNQELTQNDWSC